MSNFIFTPVNVTGGRKYRGFGYIVEYQVARFSPYRGCYHQYRVAKIWNPKTKKLVYANADFCNDVVVADTDLADAKKAYIESVINDTLEYCNSKSNSPEDAKRFARCLIRKHHPELMDVLDEYIPDNRDVALEIMNTLDWACNLRTRPCIIYGRVCKGGKPYSPKRVVRMAYSALKRKGITKLEGFEPAWALNLAIRALPKLEISEMDKQEGTTDEL